ncbi:iron-sulfur protein [Luteimicrobium album]|uniref:Cytochrome bc1 complex Rieske iron-sulfur subunit n=1 Tax=Luteimicrobium album TaxID=1054550 RepID=A0ABQ6I6F8_9MICO|nr:Rieske (2Fe-2S) protein [Luteimicrobium album]GMA26368.1 iron-sulfur protein [Luteimicrobium album]
MTETPGACCGGVSRRAVLAGAGAGVAAVALAACSPGGTGDVQITPPATPAAVAQLADVPIGGAVAAKLPAGAQILVTQPTAGDVHVLSAICTHMGCGVVPGQGDLECPCHGSTFDLTGKVTHGPAKKPLQVLTASVQDGQVVVGG